MNKIDSRLNLVLPVDTPQGVVTVHSAPISVATFRSYYLPLARTFAALHTEGIGMVAGPKIAAMLLEDTAKQMNIWDGQGGVASGLMPEIRRLTNAILGGIVVPWQEIVDKKMMADDDIAEVENAIVFFIAGWSMYPKADRVEMLTQAARLWNARLDSLNCTELAVSLRTLKDNANTGGTTTAPQEVSSIPS